MRLRQLATTQRVEFYAPPEVHQSILNFRKKSARATLDSHDVICWLLEQTCCNIEQLQPLFISQGLDYCRRLIAARRNPLATLDSDQRKDYLKILEQPEQYSLQTLYAPDHSIKARPINTEGFPDVAEHVAKINAMKKALRNTTDTVQALAHQEVEQEREVAVEVENVREVKKPLHAKGAPQQALHKDVRSFAETGRMSASSIAFEQAFVALAKTGLGRRLGITDGARTSRLFVTQDFAKTVEDQLGRPRDEYARSVRWILWSRIIAIAVVISDYEADIILSILIENGSTSPVNLITYAAPVTPKMVHFDSMTFYTVPKLSEDWRAPTWLVRDIGIFAGRLYFDPKMQRRAVYEIMGLPTDNLPDEPNHSGGEEDEENEKEKSDSESGQIPMNNAHQAETGGFTGPFSPSPLQFMQEWLAIRRKGQDFSQTMMGMLCRGRLLQGSEALQEDVMDTGAKDDNASSTGWELTGKAWGAKDEERLSENEEKEEYEDEEYEEEGFEDDEYEKEGVDVA